MDVPRRRRPQATGERRAEIREDVAEEVRRHDDVELFRPLDHPHRCGVHVHRVATDVRELRAELVEQVAPDLLHRDRVGLVDERDVLGAALRELERVAEDPLDARTRETHLDAGRLARGADRGTRSFRRVHVLGVLANHRHVDLARAFAAERREPIVIENDRAQIHVEVEPAAQPDDDVPLDHPARRIGMADRTQKHRVLSADRRELVRRQPLAGRKVVGTRPREARSLGLEAEASLAGIEDDERGVRHLRPDSVAADDPEAVGLHTAILRKTALARPARIAL